MRVLIAAGLSCIAFAIVLAAPPAGSKSEGKSSKAAPIPLPPKAGIKIPGVQIPFESLKSEAQVAVESPGWITMADSIYVPNRSKDSLVRIDAKANKTLDPVAGLNKPCSGSTVAFGSLWVPNCGDGTIARVDGKTGKITTSLSTGTADVRLGVAATPDSVWLMSDSKTTLSRIDPGENKVAGELRVPANCNSVSYGESSLWVTCPGETRLLRIDPVTNLVDKRIEVAAGARAIAFGAGSIWVLCEKDGVIQRIDPKTNKVLKTVETAVPNAGGNIAFADGFLWVTQKGFPLTRIDPQSDKEKVAQQFWGEGGGFISVTNGAIWLSNTEKGSVWRLDPKRVIATLAE